MVIEYESIADVDFYCYFVKNKEPYPHPLKGFYTIKATPHFHRNIEFLFVTGGAQVIHIEGTRYELHASDIAFVNSYMPHSYEDCDTDAYVLVLSTTYFEPFHWFFDKKVFPQLMDNKEANKEIIDFIINWHKEYKKDAKHYEVFVKCQQLFEIIASKYEISIQDESKQNELVISALKYIDNHYQDYDLSLESCSDAIGYSKEYVSKQFNMIMGVSFKTYVNNLRIKKYKELEQSTSLTKQELAQMCGFKSIATFYRAMNSSND